MADADRMASGGHFSRPAACLRARLGHQQLGGLSSRAVLAQRSVGESCSCVAADDQAHCCEQPHGIVGDAEFPHADDGGSVSGRSNSTRGIVLPMQYSIAR